MEYKVQITDEAGNVQQYVVSRSSSDEPKNLNDFIFRALQISEDKRKLPVVTDCPNGMEVFPNIKMRLKKGTEFTPQQEVEKMVITWHD